MKKREYERLRREITERFRRDMDALERVWALSCEEQSAAGKGISQAVRELVRTLDGPFTVVDVVRRIQEGAGTRVQQASVSTALRRLTKEGKIRPASSGGKGRIVKYETVSSEEHPPPEDVFDEEEEATGS